MTHKKIRIPRESANEIMRALGSRKNAIEFEDLTKDDIVCSEETPTLHILSNVLDMLNFDLEKFSALIKNSLKGYNQFVCVGPYFNYSDKDGRMDNLFSLLDGKDGFRETFDKYEFDLEKAWTAKTELSKMYIKMRQAQMQDSEQISI